MMLAIGILLGYKMNDKADMSFITTLDPDGAYPIGRVEEVLRYIDSKYVYDINTDSIANIAIQAVINSLDPHSIYITPEEMTAVNENMEGNFIGIGIESLHLDDTVNVVRVMENGPAEKGGLKNFDQIIYINDKNVAGKKIPFSDIRDLLRGEPGQEDVQLKVKRDGNEELLPFTINIGQIVVNSSELAHMINDSTGIIKIDQFSEKTYEEFMKSMEFLYDSMKMKNLIIDVRDNPGGILPQVTKIINQLFPEKGKIIVYTKGDHSNKTEYKTNGKVFFPLDKIAILINENSASAAEILAGTIQDWDRGVIIGRRTYGKGLVQEQFSLSNGGAVRLTTAKYYTPAGRSIQKDYTQKLDYDFELQDRLDKGFLTEKDTSNGEEPIKTLILGRDIYSHYGISPDIFIKGSSSQYDVNTIQLSSYSYEYIYKKIKEDRSLLKGFQVNDKTVESFLSYVHTIEPKIATTDLEPEAKTALKELLQFNFDSISLGRTGAQIKSYNTDPFVTEAVKYFASGKSLSTL